MTDRDRSTRQFGTYLIVTKIFLAPRRDGFQGVIEGTTRIWEDRKSSVLMRVWNVEENTPAGITQRYRVILRQLHGVYVTGREALNR